MDIPKTPGRKPRKQNKIADYLRKNIINGVWKKGEKIPPRSELENQFKVSSVTIQRTLTPLIQDGFLRVVPNRGTYVNEQLPNVLNYALAFPVLNPGDSKNLFFKTLRGESQKLQKDLGIKIIPYDNAISPILTDSGIQLIKDIRAERLAGIIFSTAVHFLKGSPILLEKDLSRVIISGGKQKMPCVNFDSMSFIDLAQDYLLSKGRKRIALISTNGQVGSFTDYFLEGTKKRKMVFKEYWHQMAHLSGTESAENITQLLMSDANTDKPDGIVISDDNLIVHVCAGLKKAKTKVPQDCEVVSLCNFPRSMDFDFPIKFIGIDSRKMLQECIKILQAERTGGKTKNRTIIKACHEEDTL